MDMGIRPMNPAATKAAAPGTVIRSRYERMSTISLSGPAAAVVRPLRLVPVVVVAVERGGGVGTDLHAGAGEALRRGTPEGGEDFGDGPDVTADQHGPHGGRRTNVVQGVA